MKYFGKKFQQNKLQIVVSYARRIKNPFCWMWGVGAYYWTLLPNISIFWYIEFRRFQQSFSSKFGNLSYHWIKIWFFFKLADIFTSAYIAVTTDFRCLKGPDHIFSTKALQINFKHFSRQIYLQILFNVPLGLGVVCPGIPSLLVFALGPNLSFRMTELWFISI